MINLNTFVSALKSTWIRRLLLNESKWQEIIKLHINLETLTSCNVEYIQDISSTLNNQFWKDVLNVSNGAKIRNRYNQVPHLTQDTNGKVTNSQKTPQTRAKRSALSQQVTTKHI